MDVIVIGSISYYFPLHQRLHHFAHLFARRGHRVLYVEVENARHFLTHPRQGSLEIWDNPRGEASIDLLIRRRLESVRRLGLPGKALARVLEALEFRRVLRRCLREAQARNLFPALLATLPLYRRKFTEFARAPRRLVFFQAPYHTELLPWLRERGFRVIYDMVDDFAQFTGVPPRMARAEEELLRQADLVVATSRPLAERARGYNERVVHIGNAVEYSHFVRSRDGGPRPADLPPPGRPIVGYFGAIWDWFRIEWLIEAARARPGYDYVLLGTADESNSRAMAGVPNVHYLGEKPYEELPHYLRYFDATIIPFRESRLTRAVNPVKVYEYLCGGKPVVTSPLPEIEGLPGVLTARSEGEFVELLDRAISTRPSLGELDDFVRERTWENGFARLERELVTLWADGRSTSPRTGEDTPCLT